MTPTPNNLRGASQTFRKEIGESVEHLVIECADQWQRDREKLDRVRALCGEGPTLIRVKDVLAIIDKEAA